MFRPVGDPQILADQLTLSQLGGADYAHYSTTCPPGFLTLAASLYSTNGTSLVYIFAMEKTSVSDPPPPAPHILLLNVVIYKHYE